MEAIMKVPAFCVSTLLAAALICGGLVVSGSAGVKVDSNLLGDIEARSIGPATMSGRIMALDAVNKEPRIVYVGAAGGGVWKSINGGTKFKPVFDKYTQSIGALAIDQANPETVWVGTGESDTRNSVSVGSGIYKTTDGGDNWQLMGLEKSERISRIAIDPKDSNTVYVAVPGHLWDASEDRGLYKTSDGGKTWQKILYVNPDTGCSDVVIDPQEPGIVYAATWQFRRSPYFFTSGGPGSSVQKSTDAGKTWRKLTKGLPDGNLGRIALAVAPSRTSVLYATVEAEKTYLYRSDDMGDTWTRMANPYNVQSRPFYFSHLYVDPTDYHRVYKPGFTMDVSKDGGQSFESIAGSVHSDLHALWIDPGNPFHLLVGTDGGVYGSEDRGYTWKFLRNLPVSQFYHVAYDMQIPYYVYGGLQDNGSWMGPSQAPNGIQNKAWKNVGIGDGFYTIPDPLDNDVVYSEFQGGKILRFDRSSGELMGIEPYAQEGEKLRFNWNTPIEISEKNPKALYVGAQLLFRSTNQGESWERISPDLTTNDPAKQKQEESGGITIDNSTAENHCTIFTISASPLDENLIWVGTDDGNVQVTQDGGKTWTNVTANLPGVPKNTWVSSIEAGRHNPAVAYATLDGHQTGDMKTYVVKTADFGKTWKSIATEDIHGFAHVIREDLINPDLLFVGTESGLFLTLDAGTQWAQFKGNLPTVPVHDLAIHPRESDLIIATHGRGIYIVDDITPLRRLNAQTLESKVAFLETRPAFIRFPRIEQDFPGDDEYVGSTLPEVAMITYYLKDRHMFGDCKVEIEDAQGNPITNLPCGKRKGINRVQWYMRLKPPKMPRSPQLGFGFAPGPIVPEGTYNVKLVKGGETYASRIEIHPDPTLQHSAEDRKLQEETVMKLYRMQEKLGYIADAAAGIRDQARERAGKLNKGNALARNLRTFADEVDSLYKTLLATREGLLTGEEQLKEKLQMLYLFVSFYGGRPTDSQLQRASVFEGELDKAAARLEALTTSKRLDDLNSGLKGKKLEPIRMMTREEWEKKKS
jgi:photosystem II stability/assembly factor-like uncharacterized protein